MSSGIVALGVNHKGAPTSVRQAISLDANESDRVLAAFRKTTVDAGLLIVSTCNRTELYVDAESDHLDLAHQALRSVQPDPVCTAASDGWYELHGSVAAGHLFRVVSGLESPILGDTQILAQVRRSVSAARAAGTLSKGLERLTRQALELGRQVRRETPISAGGVGVGSATVDLIDARLPHGHSSKILVIGAGEAGRAVIGHLAHRHYGDVTVANRTRERAEAVAERCNVGVLDLGEAAAHLNDFEVVVLAAPLGANSPVEPDLSAGDHRRPLVIDLVPGGALHGDLPEGSIQLDDLADAPIGERAGAVPAVEELCDQAIAEWEASSRRVPFDAAIAELFGACDALCDDLVELLRAEPDPARAHKAIRTALRRAIHTPVTRIRELATESQPRVDRHPDPRGVLACAH